VFNFWPQERKKKRLAKVVARPLKMSNKKATTESGTKPAATSASNVCCCFIFIFFLLLRFAFAFVLLLAVCEFFFVSLQFSLTACLPACLTGEQQRTRTNGG